MRRRQLLLGAAAVAGLLASCSGPPASSELLGESIVLTKRAPEADFGAYHTFFIRPEIRILDDDDEDDEVADERYANPLLAATIDGLTDRGYVEVDTQAEAELAVELVYVRSVTTSVSCYSWWDPYYWGYPAWGYYPYYGSCSASTWRAGTLATMMVDLTPALGEPPPAEGSGGAGAGGAPSGEVIDKLLSTIWFSGVYGVEYDTTADTVSRARDGIVQAFAQSPYLETTP